VRRRRWITQAEFLDRLRRRIYFRDRVRRSRDFCRTAQTRLARAAGCWVLLHYSRGADCVGHCMGLRALWLAAEVEGVLYAIKPAVVAIVIQALLKLGRSGVRTVLLAVIALLAVGLSLLGVSPVLVLVCRVAVDGVFGDEEPVAGRGWIAESSRASESCCRSNGGCSRGRGFSGWDLAAVLVVFEIGSVMFGRDMSARVSADRVVERLHWLTEKQLIDAVAVGQFTPRSAVGDGDVYRLCGGRLERRDWATVGISCPGSFW